MSIYHLDHDQTSGWETALSVVIFLALGVILCSVIDRRHDLEAYDCGVNTCGDME